MKISFLSKYFLGHRSIISPPICVTCLAFQGLSGWRKESPVPIPRTSRSEKVDGEPTPEDTRTESRSPTGVRTDAALRYCIFPADAKTSELLFSLVRAWASTE